MLFNSLLFLLFFIITSVIYYILPHRFRWLMLLIASCYFYMYFKPIYVLIIFTTIFIDYFAGIWIERTEGQSRKTFLVISLITNIGILCYFKYFNFFAENINSITSDTDIQRIHLLNFILPIGLSFHTFQAMSYTIEVYRRNQKAERHFGIYALYVMFYPQMVAGPIERPQHILPQFHKIIAFSKENIIKGLFFMAIGIAKKVIIADRLGLYVDPIFNNPQTHSSLDLLYAVYLFTFQIYCDFSGYSDIAIGAALVLGINLMKNFNAPYLALNISEFWKRWHISLSSWFKDYLYIPLGGNRKFFAVTCVNLMIVFIISGLWHGADWKYILWGTIHGFFLIIYQIFKRLNIRLSGTAFLQWIITFHIIAFAWVFFRASSIQDAFHILTKIFSGSIWKYKAHGIMSINEIIYCFLLILMLLISEKYFKITDSLSLSKRLMLICVIAVCCYFLGIFNEAQFIYFQF